MATDSSCFSALSHSVHRRDQKLSVILVGETGSGKSTLINYLTNYMKGGSLANPRIAIPTRFYEATERYADSERDLDNPMQSQTRHCQNYEFQLDDQNYGFIDTPGLSDTSGNDKDDTHIEHIIQAAEDAGALSAVALVINGTMSRATNALRNTLTRLRGILPDCLMESLIVILTNCSATSYNFDVESLQPWNVEKCILFFMDNNALGRDPRFWENNERRLEDRECKWKKSMETISELLCCISGLPTKPTRIFRTVRQCRDQLKLELHEIFHKILALQEMQNDLEEAQHAYQIAASNTNQHSNFQRMKMIESNNLVPAVYYNVACKVHPGLVCHANYRINFASQAELNLAISYPCMSEGKCESCGCGYKHHYHSKVKTTAERRTVADDQPEMDAAQQAEEWKTSAAKIQDDIIGLQKLLRTKQARLNHFCRELQTICSSFDFSAEMSNMLNAMERTTNMLTSSTARQEVNTMTEAVKQIVESVTSRTN